MKYFAKDYDVIVIGAGHAGIEAGLAAARLGMKVGVFTINKILLHCLLLYMMSALSS